MTKKMPSEHRITGLEPGDTKLIENDHGTFILVRVPFEHNEELLVDLINCDAVEEAISNQVKDVNQVLIDGAQDKANDHANDQL